ncbi:MAG: hypothetical protein IKZ44_06815 [Clostridia bacterium]|nr:hypothetical protein [Clostridia bacterium]
MTKETAVTQIVANIATLRGISNSTKENQIRVYANRYYDSACAFTGYSELPDALLSFVEDATLQAWMKRGSEGLNSQSAAGVSEHYLDVEYSLRQNLRYKRNPLSAVHAVGNEV